MMLAGDGPYGGGGGGGALSCSISFTGGVGPINVSGASGDCYANGGGGVITTTTTGGTPPYVSSVFSVQGDASGKLSIVLSGDHIHNTIGYSGFAVNENEGGYLRLDVTDSVGATASAQYPSSGVIVIKRAS
jgi:hypothetical protein